MPANSHDLRWLQRPDSIEALLKGLPRDELHHQVRQWLFLNRVHLHEILMAHPGGRTGFAQESLACWRSNGQCRGQHLDGDHALKHVVERAEDDTEPSLAKHFQHIIMADAPDRVGPGGRRQEMQTVLAIIRRRDARLADADGIATLGV